LKKRLVMAASQSWIVSGISGRLCSVHSLFDLTGMVQNSTAVVNLCRSLVQGLPLWVGKFACCRQSGVRLPVSELWSIMPFVHFMPVYQTRGPCEKLNGVPYRHTT
jgi:hypothetical protein